MGMLMVYVYLIGHRGVECVDSNNGRTWAEVRERLNGRRW